MKPQRLSAEQRREQILSCSINVLAKSNYQKSRVTDIADLVGVTEAAIYKYFPTKKHLFIAVLNYMSDRLMNSLASVIEAEADPIEALRKAATAFADPDVNPPDHIRIGPQETVRPDSGDQLETRALQTSMRALSRYAYTDEPISLSIISHASAETPGRPVLSDMHH